MLSRNQVNSLSIICLIFFGITAAGSMDSDKSSSPSAPSSEPTLTGSSPADQKTAVIDVLKFKYTWSSDGMIMSLNYKIENPTDRPFKDFEITCNHFGPSGTKIDSNTRTVYEIVKAHGKKAANRFNMGFIHSQATSSSCKVTDLVLLN